MNSFLAEKLIQKERKMQESFTLSLESLITARLFICSSCKLAVSIYPAGAAIIT